MQQQVQVVDETLKVFCPEFPVHDFPLIITWLVGKKNDHKRGITYASNSNFAFLLKEFFYLYVLQDNDWDLNRELLRGKSVFFSVKARHRT